MNGRPREAWRHQRSSALGEFSCGALREQHSESRPELHRNRPRHLQRVAGASGQRPGLMRLSRLRAGGGRTRKKRDGPNASRRRGL